MTLSQQSGSQPLQLLDAAALSGGIESLVDYINRVGYRIECLQVVFGGYAV